MTIRKLFVCSVVLLSLSLLAQDPVSSVIEPSHASIVIGQSQAFQLLGRGGEEISASNWTVSDPDIADFQIDGAHAILTAKATGHVALQSSDGVQAEIDVVDPEVVEGWPPTHAKWTLQPIDGEFRSVLWATGAWGGSATDADPATENDPAYFYEDHGTSGSHLRAIGKNGLQVWQWPSNQSALALHLICGDIYNGALLRLGDGASTTLVDLDSNGQERWHLAAPGFSGKEFAYNMSGALYFVEQENDATSVHLIGVDAHSGSQLFSFELPASTERDLNFTIRNGKLICSPGAHTSTPVPIHYSHMMSDFDNVSHLIYTEFSLTAIAGRCTPGSTLDAAKIQIDALQKVAVAEVYENHAVSTHVLEENKSRGAASTVLVKSAVPTGDITFDERGGVATFFAVRTTTHRWRDNSSSKIENFQYRITADAGVTYRFSVPGDGQHNIMILGRQGPGVVTLGDTVTAFEPETGRELWRWQSKNTDLVPYEALQDGAVAIRDGDKYTVLKDGKVQMQLDETYVRFVKMFRPPELNF
jgi:outer membrane protein assembly factor BamB